MTDLNEKFLMAIREERSRLVSRRNLLGAAPKVAGGAALMAVAAGAPFSRSLQSAVAQDFTDDLDILNYALTLEHLEATFYREGLDKFDEGDFEDVFGHKCEDESEDNSDTKFFSFESSDDIRGRFEEIRDHEEDHVKTLTDTINKLGGTPVDEGKYDFGYDDLAGFCEVAMALENTGVAAYAGAGPFITDDAVVAAALSIHSVEARHASYLNLRLGESPFPDSFDEPLTRHEVLEIASKFIVDTGASSGDETATSDDTSGSGSSGGDTATAEATGAATEEPTTEATEVATEAPTDVVPTVDVTVDPTVDVTVEATVTT
jgi:rubrerythrin